MNDQPQLSSDDRHVRTGKFFARVYRYRNLLVKRWWVLLICLGLALGAETLYLKYTPPVFISVGQMIVSIKLNIQQGSLYTEELGNFLGTQAALMQGSEVVQRARDRVANQNTTLTPKPVLLNVSVLPKTTIFVLRATGENPDYTKAYLQACMEEYISLKKQMVARTSDTTIAGLTEQVMRLEPELQKCDAEMQSFLSTNDIALMEQASGLGGYLTSIYQQLANAQSESDLLQTMTLDQNLLLEQGRTPVISGSSGAGVGNGILVNAGLEGNALRHAQEEEAIDAITLKFHEGEISKQSAAAETAAVQKKFAREALKLQAQLDEQTRHMADDAAQAGLKGNPLIQAQLKTQLHDIDAAEQKTVGLLGIETPDQTADFNSQRDSQRKISGQKGTEEQQQFNDKIRELTQSSDDSQIQGYARVEAETQRHLDTLSKDYEEQYGKDQSLWIGYQQTKAQIQTTSDEQMVQLHQKTMEQIAKEEEQTARQSLAPWLQSALAIQDAWQDKVRAIDDDEDQQLAHLKQNSDDERMLASNLFFEGLHSKLKTV